MKPIKILALLIVGLLAGPMAAHAVVIDFAADQSDASEVQFRNGYRFAFTAAGFGTFTNSFVGAGAPWTHNGTTRLVATGNRNGITAQVAMTELGGASFSIYDFDAATLFPDLGKGQLQVIGSLGDGGTVSSLFDLLPAFHSFSLSGFENLTSVVFRTTLPGGFRGEPGISLDNLFVNQRRNPTDPGPDPIRIRIRIRILIPNPTRFPNPARSRCLASDSRG